MLILYLLEFCPSTEFYRLYGFLNVDGYAACLRPPYCLISGHYECHSKHFLIFLVHPYTLILIAKLRLCLQLACVHYLFLCIPSNSSSLVYFTYLVIKLQNSSMSLFNRLEHELCRLVNDSWASAAKFCGLNGIYETKNVFQMSFFYSY